MGLAESGTFCCLRSLSQPFPIFSLSSQRLLSVTLYLLGAPPWVWINFQNPLCELERREYQ